MELKHINPKTKSTAQETLGEIKAVNKRLADIEKDIATMKVMLGFLYRKEHPNHKLVEEFMKG